jgi:hypothetical protein
MDNTDKLYEHIFTESTITCTKCDRKDELMADGYEAADAWGYEGWIVVRDEVLCPSCNEKRRQQAEARKKKKKPAKKRKPAHR